MTPKTMFVNRREFLALAGAACFNIGNAATLPRAVGKGRRIRMALVGCGNRGTNFLLQEVVQEQVVALADPNAKNLEAALAKLRNLDPSCDTSKRGGGRQQQPPCASRTDGDAARNPRVC